MTTYQDKTSDGRHIVPVGAAAFGQLPNGDNLSAISPLHAAQPSVLFQVDVPRSITLPGHEPMGMHSLEFEDGIPVAVVGFPLGRLFILAAFNPMDPATRAMMKRVSASGHFTFAVEFDCNDGVADESKPFERILAGLPEDVFGEALKKTRTRGPVKAQKWLSISHRAMTSALVDLNVGKRFMSDYSLRMFNVLPLGGWPEAYKATNERAPVAPRVFN